MITKLLSALSFLFLLSVAQAQFPAPYCPEAYGTGVEPITSVVFANINNTSPATIGSSPHQDFLSVVGNVLSGASYNMTVKGNTDGNYTSYIRVFIDWNKDNDFDDASESNNIGTITNSTGLDAISVSASISVPANQTAGNVRMRVTKKFGSYQTPCNITGFGQSEDYTLSVTVPSCLSPTSVTVSDIGSTTATVNWTAVTGATNYEYSVTTSALAPETGTEVESSGVPVNSLTPNTLYYAHVRTNCGAGGLSIWTTTSFTTDCAVGNVPYSQNFNGVTAPAIPSCIKVEDFNAGSFWTTRSAPATVVIGAPNSMVYGFNATIPADDWFYLQGLNLTGGTSYRLSFKWKSNPTYPERFEILYGRAPTADSMNVGTLYTNNSAGSSTVVTETIDFTPTSSGAYFIGFHVYSVADQDFLSIDDISVIVTPSCLNPSSLSHTPASGNSTTVSWGAVSGASGYQWVVNTSATPPASGAATTSTSALAAGLVAGTSYYAHVRTDCGAGNFSPWSTLPFGWLPNDSVCGAISLTLDGLASCTNTSFATATNDPALPGGCSSPNNTVWFSFTPTISGAALLKAEIPSGSANGLNGWVAWYTISSCPNPSFTVVPGSECQSFSSTPGNVTLQVSPSLVAGTTYYIMIDGVSNDVGEACISLQTLPQPPSCVPNVSPANNTTGIGISPAPFLTWRSDANANGYNIIFGTTNPPLDTLGVTADTTVSISGLDFNTTYYWYVSPVGLGGDAIGCAGNATSFTTSGPATNCLPGVVTGCAFADRIDLFRLKGETGELNISTTSICPTNAYLDTTDHATIIDLARGKSYWGQAKAGTTGDYLTLWLDGNDNGFFEDSERLMNNLLISSTTNTNINLHIPTSVPEGNHTLKARLVYYQNPPTEVTDACGYYEYGETEDYKVNIVSAGSSYTLASYTGPAACYTGSGVITIDSASNNNLNFVPLVDSNNAIIAQLYPEGNNLGRVTTSYYKHNGSVRQDNAGRYYLDRNFTITAAQQPNRPYGLRLHYLNSELNALIAQPGSGVTTQFDLAMTKNQDACSTAIGSGGASTQLIVPTGFGVIGSDRFLDFTNITSGFSSFYLHGGTTPLPVSLVKFMVQRTGRINQVSWSTSQEINTSHFIIERSSDGRNFAEVGRINAHGNSNTLLNYGFTDLNPVRGINYYRLKMIDLDNSNKYSAIRSVRNEGLADVSVYPNPVKNELMVNIDADKAGTSNLLVTDFSGKLLFTYSVKLVKGNNKVPINTSTLTGGTYLLTMQLDEDSIVKKFTKF